MQITILAFGIAKDIIGGTSLEIQLPPGSTVATLKANLSRQFPDFQRLASLSVAVNTEYASDDQALREQDEIVLIPPVSGGDECHL